MRDGEIIGYAYLGEFKEYQVDALVLGCTHYPLLSNTIRRILGDGIKLVNPAYETAKSLKTLLTEKDLLNNSGVKGKHKYYVSDMTDQFVPFADRVFPAHVRK